jgi:hypothetical protein
MMKPNKYHRNRERRLKRLYNKRCRRFRYQAAQELYREYLCEQEPAPPAKQPQGKNITINLNEVIANIDKYMAQTPPITDEMADAFTQILKKAIEAEQNPTGHWIGRLRYRLTQTKASLSHCLASLLEIWHLW